MISGIQALTSLLNLQSWRRALSLRHPAWVGFCRTQTEEYAFIRAAWREPLELGECTGLATLRPHFGFGERDQ
jgi:hypothetical protein